MLSAPRFMQNYRIPEPDPVDRPVLRRRSLHIHNPPNKLFFMCRRVIIINFMYVYIICTPQYGMVWLYYTKIKNSL